MLQPPGSSSGRSKKYATSRRKAQEVTPEEILRQLQRNAPNKRCADCGTKLPQCVNLTISSFVCIGCAGIHRELNFRVKGIGHSSFTMEEVDRLKQTDNDQVNALWSMGETQLCALSSVCIDIFWYSSVVKVPRRSYITCETTQLNHS